MADGLRLLLEPPSASYSGSSSSESSSSLEEEAYDVTRFARLGRPKYIGDTGLTSSSPSPLLSPSPSLSPCKDSMLAPKEITDDLSSSGSGEGEREGGFDAGGTYIFGLGIHLRKKGQKGGVESVMIVMVITFAGGSSGRRGGGWRGRWRGRWRRSDGGWPQRRMARTRAVREVVVVKAAGSDTAAAVATAATVMRRERGGCAPARGAAAGRLPARACRGPPPGEGRLGRGQLGQSEGIK